jgi:hypothetical protein
MRDDIVLVVLGFCYVVACMLCASVVFVQLIRPSQFSVRFRVRQLGFVVVFFQMER